MSWGVWKTGLVSALGLLASACEAELPKTNLAVIAANARVLLDDNKLLTRPAPEAFAYLKPEEVRRTPEGIYICMDRRGYQAQVYGELGYFIPRDPVTFDPRSDRNTRYRLLGDGVYRYEVSF